MRVNLRTCLELTPACVAISLMSFPFSLPALANAAAPGPHGSARNTLTTTSDNFDEGSNPYGVIVDRNVFRLVPPPPLKTVEEKPIELPKVNFNGIFKMGNNIRVLFSIPPKDAKSQTAYFKLAPGEKQDALELVNIHPDQKEVDVLVNGTAETLSMASNNAAASGKGVAAAPPPGPRGGAPVAPVAAAAASTGGSSAIIGGDRGGSRYGSVTVSGGGSGGGVTTIGGNNGSSYSGGVTVSGGGDNNPTPSSYAGNGVPGGNQIANTLLAGALGSGSGSVGGVPTPTTAIPPEQQAALMAARSLIDPQLPPLPPDFQQQLNETLPNLTGTQK